MVDPVNPSLAATPNMAAMASQPSSHSLDGIPTSPRIHDRAFSRVTDHSSPRVSFAADIASHEAAFLNSSPNSALPALKDFLFEKGIAIDELLTYMNKKSSSSKGDSVLDLHGTDIPNLPINTPVAPVNKQPMSWKSIVASPSNKSGVVLSYYPPSIVGESIEVTPPKDVLLHGMELWSSCLVGSFLNFKLPFKLVEHQAFKWWSSFGLQKVILHEKGYFLFKFDSVAHRDEALAGGPKHVASKLLLLQQWREGVNFSNASVASIPLWVKFSNIPLSYWTSNGLSYIASSIGRPIAIDDTTAKLDPLPFARICVEVKADSNFPKSINVAIIGEDGLSYVPVAVDYQSKPPICSSCKIFGHSTSKCPKVVKQHWVPKASTVVDSSKDGEWTVVTKGSKSKAKSPTKAGSSHLGDGVGAVVTTNDPKLATGDVANNTGDVAIDDIVNDIVSIDAPVVPNVPNVNVATVNVVADATSSQAVDIASSDHNVASSNHNINATPGGNASVQAGVHVSKAAASSSNSFKLLADSDLDAMDLEAQHSSSSLLVKLNVAKNNANEKKLVPPKLPARKQPIRGSTSK